MALRNNKRDPHGQVPDIGSLADANVVSDSRLVGLKEQLAAAEQRLDAARERLAPAQARMDDMEKALVRIESRQSIGLADARQVEAARHERDAAKQAHAHASAEVEEAERLVAVLPEAMTELRQRLLTELRDQLRQATDAHFKRLLAVLAEAKQLSDGLAVLHDCAERNFRVGELLHIEGGMGLHPVLDLGPEGGFVGNCAGIPPLSVPWLTPYNVNTTSLKSVQTLFDVWAGEVREYLKRSPEERAAEDRERRVSTIAAARERKRKALADEAAYEELERQMRQLGRQMAAPIARNAPRQ